MPNVPTIAYRLGGTAHLSPLLRKAGQLGLASSEALLWLAVSRGCTHYMPPDFSPTQVVEPGRDSFSDTELAIALISGAQTYDPQCMRCAAQLLGSDGIDPRHLVQLALMERCVSVLRHIAEAAQRYDSGHEVFWGEVVQLLPKKRAVLPGILPHPSRFMISTGLMSPLRTGKVSTVWLRPRPSMR